MREQGLYGNFVETIWRPFMKSSAKSSAILVVVFFLFAGAFLSIRLVNTTNIAGVTLAPILTTTSNKYPQKKPEIPKIPRPKIEIPLNCKLSPLLSLSMRLVNTTKPEIPKIPRPKIEIPLNCTAYNPTRTCPSKYPTTYNPEEDRDRSPPSTCPDYFRWIHEDLRPWSHTGISRDMVERAKRTANFRLVIVKGKAYVERYQKSF